MLIPHAAYALFNGKATTLDFPEGLPLGEAPMPLGKNQAGKDIIAGLSIAAGSYTDPRGRSWQWPAVSMLGAFVEALPQRMVTETPVVGGQESHLHDAGMAGFAISVQWRLIDNGEDGIFRNYHPWDRPEIRALRDILLVPTTLNVYSPALAFWGISRLHIKGNPRLVAAEANVIQLQFQAISQPSEEAAYQETTRA